MYRPHTSPPDGHPNKQIPSKEDIMDTIEQFGSNGTANGHKSGPCRVATDELVDVDQDLQRAPSEVESEDLESTSFSASYSSEWNRLFGKPNYMSTLKHMGINGKLRSSRFRSVCWKLYLEVLPKDRDTWLDKTRAWRNTYKDLKTRLIVNPRREMDMTSDLAVNNPLSQEVESPWNQFFLDNELRLTIKQDVIRTFPELEFFQACEVHEKMVDILFCYVRDQDIDYRQGMHELLAPLIFVLHCDHQAYLHASEMERLEGMVSEMLDPQYIEHDAYAMFYQIMETVEPWYMCREKSPSPNSSESVPTQPFCPPRLDFSPTNVILTKLTRVHDYLLKKVDPELHAMLEQMEIAPQIYGIRWVRLLFGREYPMQDLLVLWDAIFSDGISFDLVDYIFVAMLLYLRDYMLNSDYASCLKCLMRYPPVGDIHYMVQKALFLREPSQHRKPPNYTFHAPRTAMSNGAGEHHVRAHTKYHEKPRSLMSGLSSLTRRIGHGRPGSLGILSNKMAKSTSEPMKLQTEQPSPAGPEETWDRIARRKRGSASSLPALGETETMTIRPTISSQSLAQLETTGVRSLGSTASLNRGEISPDDTSSPGTKYATLPTRGRKASSRKQSKLEAALEHQITHLQEKLHEVESMCQYCSAKMDSHIGKLQSEMLRQEVENEDEILLTLAGLKQVRDVLKGTLKFNMSMLDNDDSSSKDPYYREDCSSQASSNASSAQSSPAKIRTLEFGASKKRGFYYPDSGDSEVDSPDNMGDPLVHSIKLKDARREIELGELEGRKPRSGSQNGSVTMGH